MAHFCSHHQPNNRWHATLVSTKNHSYTHQKLVGRRISQHFDSIYNTDTSRKMMATETKNPWRSMEPCIVRQFDLIWLQSKACQSWMWMKEMRFYEEHTCTSIPLCSWAMEWEFCSQKEEESSTADAQCGVGNVFLWTPCDACHTLTISVKQRKNKHNRDVSLSFLNVISTHSVTPSRLPNELEQITPQNWRKHNNNNKCKNHHQLQWS
jgi:hypothetical protein